MADIYDIFIFDTNGVQRYDLRGWEYLEFHQRINAPWNHYIRIRLSQEDETLTFLRDTLDVDWIFIVVRTDPVTNGRDLVYEGVHRTLVDQLTLPGTVIVSLYGSGFTEFLTRRVVVPPTGFENDAQTGAAETNMKAFVDNQMVSAVDVDRVFPGLTVEADSAKGPVIEYSPRYTNLYTVITTLSERGPIDFAIVGGDPLAGGAVGAFEFQARTLWGTDRSTMNVLRNMPTIFDVQLNNMAIPILSINSSEERNVAYVGGPGQGINRTIQEVEYTLGIALSPWNRRECFIDARQELAIDALTAFGAAYLAQNKVQYRLTFNLLQTEGTRWLRDWSLGDIITARYGTFAVNKQIREVAVQVSAGQSGQIEFLSAEMVDEPVGWRLGTIGYSELGETTLLERRFY